MPRPFAYPWCRCRGRWLQQPLHLRRSWWRCRGARQQSAVRFDLTLEPSVGVSDRGVLNQPVNLFCVLPIPDGDAKRHKVYTSSGNRGPTSSLRGRSCIPCTEVLVVGGYKLKERGSWSQVLAGCRAGRLRRCSQAAGMCVCVCVTRCSSLPPPSLSGPGPLLL